jgi:hypothetical protein
MVRSGALLDGAPDRVINLDRIAVENVVHARRQNAWINASENVLAKRNNSKRSSVASSVRFNARNAPAKVAKTWTLKE